MKQTIIEKTIIMDLKLLLWNARRLRGKKEKVIEYFKDSDIKVITETKNRQEENIRMPYNYYE